jgi:nitroreductase
MDFQELVSRRYSCRSYKTDPIEGADLQTILEAARIAPTAANRQPFRIIVIHTKGRAEELKEIYHRDWFSQAPLVICACGVPGEGWERTRHDGRNYTMVDVAIVVDHITLQAADLGLGTCWVAAFNPEAARKILNLPDHVEPIAFTPLGYPNDDWQQKSRKPLDELVRYEKWD